MPFKNAIPLVASVASSPEQPRTLSIQALRAEVQRFEAVRDSAVAQATNPEQADLARAALQADIDRVQRQLDAELQQLQNLP